MVEEAVVDFLEQTVPVIGLILTEESHGGVPRSVGAVQAPAPVRGVGQQQPGGLAQRAGEVRGGRLAAEGVQEFMFVLGQAKLKGTVQMIINPVAMW